MDIGSSKRYTIVDTKELCEVMTNKLLLSVRFICYNLNMSIVDELEKRAVSEAELRQMLEEYETLYIEEPDKARSEEYYELDLYLEARLAACEDVKENESDEVKHLKARIKELEAENKALCKRAAGSGDDMLSKEDIMVKFGCGSDWALRFLHFCYMNKKATKLGRKYYTRESDISQMYNIFKGKDVILGRG